MTAAGIATLYITQDYITGDLAACRGNVTNENIEHGLVWMDRHIKQELAGDDYYTLYGIERIGVASGRKFFDGINWYESGAKSVLAQQKENGSWGDNIPDTCFAMLFLVRGRAPVVMNKLEYDLLDAKGNTIEGNWNERPRDCANFARWMGQQLERDLNWQAVNLNVSVDDLQDAPILYISGNQELRFKDEQMKKLRTYIDRGGMILGNPDCASRTFTASFERLGKQLFPEASYKFRELEASHPILNDQMFHITRGHPRVRLRSMSNGVREIMMIAPDGDIGRFWQMQADRTHADAYEGGVNIFLYAIDKKGLRYKGESLLVREDASIKSQATVSIGRLEAGADPDPEPGGWPRLAAIMHNENRVALDIQPIQPIAGELNQVQIVHLTGTSSFQFTADQRAAIVAYIESRRHIYHRRGRRIGFLCRVGRGAASPDVRRRRQGRAGPPASAGSSALSHDRCNDRSGLLPRLHKSHARQPQNAAREGDHGQRKIGGPLQPRRSVRRPGRPADRRHLRLRAGIGGADYAKSDPVSRPA